MPVSDYKGDDMPGKIGVIHGRFQPLHNGHMEYLLAGKRRCDFLFVGITNPDPEMTNYNYTNPSRSEPSYNPLTYYERFLMLRDSLLEVGLNHGEFDIVPFPINHPHRIRYYVPMDSVFFTTVYDEWGREKVKLLRALNLNVDVMWEKPISEKIISGEQLRGLIANEGKWEHLVPHAVVRIIKENGIDERIKQNS